MKKLIMILSIGYLTAFQVNAQDAAISSLFDKYADNEELTKVSISQKMFSLFTNLEPDDPETKELANAISKLKGVKILASDSIADGRKYYREASQNIRKSQFEELMSVRDGDKDMVFMIKESGGIISELLMLVGGDHQFVAMDLFGEIDLKQISKLSKGMNMKGMEYLENIDQDSKKGKE
ncbi:MAG: DUF4252 domain-containing protein [Tunicatimonas sp.]